MKAQLELRDRYYRDSNSCFSALMSSINSAIELFGVPWFQNFKASSCVHAVVEQITCIYIFNEFNSHYEFHFAALIYKAISFFHIIIVFFICCRAGPINDVYATRYAHERQSPSPYTERWENRRRSRDFSPHLSPATGEKSAKKRSHEGFGIPRDLIPDRKNHSPSTQAPFSGLRHSKSPLKHQAKSPPEHTGQTTSTNKLYVNSPYVFPPLATAGLPFSLPPGSYMNELNGPAVNKTVADAITAASLSQVSQFLRPSLPQEVGIPF